jgi:hypothetical protein
MNKPISPWKKEKLQNAKTLPHFLGQVHTYIPETSYTMVGYLDLSLKNTNFDIFYAFFTSKK